MMAGVLFAFHQLHITAFLPDGARECVSVLAADVTVFLFCYFCLFCFSFFLFGEARRETDVAVGRFLFLGGGGGAW